MTQQNLLPHSITHFLKNFRKKSETKLKDEIISWLYHYYFIIIYGIIFVAFIKLFTLLFPKEQSLESIISYGEKITILIATFVLLTFTYASVLEHPEKKAVRRSGEYFLKSVLTFVSSMIFLLGLRGSFFNPSNPFSLPDILFYLYNIVIIILFLSGFVMLLLSANFLASGMTDLIKSLKN